ncbi:hypothetical protein T4B_9953, partial [Trichinella pseudospiralis]
LMTFEKKSRQKKSRHTSEKADVRKNPPCLLLGGGTAQSMFAKPAHLLRRSVMHGENNGQLLCLFLFNQSCFLLYSAATTLSSTRKKMLVASVIVHRARHQMLTKLLSMIGSQRASNCMYVCSSSSSSSSSCFTILSDKFASDLSRWLACRMLCLS